MHVVVVYRLGGRAKILVYATGAAAAAALLCAALNLIRLAGVFFVGTLALVAIHLLLLLYLRLPEIDRAKVSSKRVIRRAALASVVLAVGLSCTYWYATWLLPLDHIPPASSFLAEHWRKLDLIPAMFAQVLPASWQSGFHQYFRGGWTYCFPGPYWWESMRYLRAAIPGYSIVFFFGLLFVRLGVVRVRRLLR
jgi:hypothetical protein